MRIHLEARLAERDRPGLGGMVRVALIVIAFSMLLAFAECAGPSGVP